MEQLITYALERSMRDVADSFWNIFPDYNDESPSGEGFKKFREAVDVLYRNIIVYMPVINTLQELINLDRKERIIYKEKTVFNTFKVIIRSSLHPGLLFHSLKIVEDFYKVSFKVFLNTDPDDSTEDAVQCGGCDNSMDSCICHEITQTFLEVNNKLMEFDLLERIAGDILTNLIHERIENHVQETCKGSFDSSYIESLENVSQGSLCRHFF